MSKSLVVIGLAATLLLVEAAGGAAHPAKVLHHSPVIGIKVVPVTADVATLLNLDHARGLLVVLVVPGSLAAQAGIARDDVIVSANGHAINSKSELAAALQSAAASHRLVFEVWRGGAMVASPIAFEAPGEKGVAVGRPPADGAELPN